MVFVHRLMEFVPANKRTEEYFINLFSEKELGDVVRLHKAQASQEARRDLTQVTHTFYPLHLLYLRTITKNLLLYSF